MCRRGALVDVYRHFAEFYDLYVGDRLDDLPLYRGYARRARTPIVEIGAGSGRLTIPLARSGARIVAVDVSRAMLRILRRRLRGEPLRVRRRIRVVPADAARLDLRFRSELIIVPFYAFNYFLGLQALRALRRFAGHLTDDGRLLVDVFVPLGHLRRCPDGPVLRVDAVDAAGRRVRGWNAYRLDRRRRTEIRRQRFVIEAPGRAPRRGAFTIRRRYWLGAELDRLFRRGGFEVERVFAGYDGRAPVSGSEQRLYVLRRVGKLYSSVH